VRVHQRKKRKRSDDDDADKRTNSSFLASHDGGILSTMRASARKSGDSRNAYF
jgi:hypothetical protein